MSTTIKFNGKEYSSVEEMPADIRLAYQALTRTFADKNQDGVPDIFEGLGSPGTHRIEINQTKVSKIIYNGKEYSNREEMPADARAEYDKAMDRLMADEDKNGVPDVFEIGSANIPQVSRQISQVRQSLPPAVPTSTSSRGTNDTMIFLIGIIIVVLLLVVAGLLFLLLFGPSFLQR